VGSNVHDTYWKLAISASAWKRQAHQLCPFDCFTQLFDSSELMVGVEYLEYKVHGSVGVCRLSYRGGVSSSALKRWVLLR